MKILRNAALQLVAAVTMTGQVAMAQGAASLLTANSSQSLTRSEYLRRVPIKSGPITGKVTSPARHRQSFKAPMKASSGRPFDLYAYSNSMSYWSYFHLPYTASGSIETWDDGIRGDGYVSNVAAVGDYCYIQAYYPGYMLGMDEDYRFSQVMLKSTWGYDAIGMSEMSGEDVSQDAADSWAKAVAVSPETQKIYYIRDVDNATELFTLVQSGPQYDVFEKTHIADLPGDWNAIAFDDEGQLYGIRVSKNDSGEAENSSLYKIDSNNGSVTEIGATGKKPYNCGGAAIDPNTNTLYWLVCEGAGKDSQLVSLNLENGSASTVTTFDASYELTSLFGIAGPDPSKPNEPTDLSFNFEGPSLSGKVTFKAPETNISGESDDPLTYTVSYSGQTETGSCSYGETVTVDVTVPNEGIHTFRVSVASATASSSVISYEVYVGRAIPPSVSPVLTYDEDGKRFIVEWNEPDTRYVGGYLDPDGFTYTVTRFPDNKVVASGIKDRRFEESAADFSESFTRYYYKVDVYNFDLCSTGLGETERYALGYLTPPFTEDFNNGRHSLAGYTVADLDRLTDRTWKAMGEYLQASNSTVSSEPSDDWLITPAAYLERGKTYFIEADAWGVSYSSSENQEILRVYAATKPEPMSLRDGVELGRFSITNNIASTEHVKCSFSPATSGYYYIGLRHNTPGVNHLYGLCIDNFKFSSGVADNAPSAPVLEVARQINGRFEADVKVKIPTSDLLGNAIDNISMLDVCRDDKVVKTFEASQLSGKTEVQFTDIVDRAGDHVWTAVAYNDAGAGEYSEPASAFIGQLEPDTPKLFTVADTEKFGTLHAEWEPVSHDKQGNEIDPSRVTYRLSDYGTRYFLTGGIIVDKYAGTSYDFVSCDESETQQWRYYALRAITDGGVGLPVYSNSIVTGKPVGEYFENFADGSPNYHPAVTLWTESLSESCANWSMTGIVPPGIKPFSGKCQLSMAGLYDGDAARITTTRFDLSQQKNPAFSLMVYNNSDGHIVNTNTIAIEVRTEGSDTWERIASREIGRITMKHNSWAPYIVSLERYAGKVIQVRITGTVANYSYIIIDELRFGSIEPDEVALEALTVPAKANPSKRFTATAQVSNLGSETVEDLKVVFEYNGISREVPCSPLASGENITAETEFTMPDYEEASTMDVRATVVADRDTDPDNNTLTEKVYYIPSSLPAPENLRGEIDEQTGSPLLSWDAPAKSTFEPVTEKFSDAAPFDYSATSFNDWIFIDRDGAVVHGIYHYILPYGAGIVQGETKSSFFVLDGTLLEPKYGNWMTGYDDYLYLASMSGDCEGRTDDWAISPELSGEAQVASMMVRQLYNSTGATFSVYYSTGSTDPDDFIPVEGLTDIEPLPTLWAEVYIALPEGARRMAIRSQIDPEESSMIHIDNISFVSAKTIDVAPLRYNVYRDNRRAGRIESDAFSWLDSGADMSEAHTYRVTSMYDLGESNPTKAVTIAPARLETPGDAGNFSVWAVSEAIHISGCNGKRVAICDALGRSLFNSLVADSVAVRVVPGIYIVTVGNQSVKVIL